MCLCQSGELLSAHRLTYKMERTHVGPGGNFSQWETQSICFRNLHVCILGAQLEGGGCYWRQARVWGRCGCACDSVGGSALIGSEKCWVPGVVFPMCLQSKLTLLYLDFKFISGQVMLLMEVSHPTNTEWRSAMCQALGHSGE